MFHVLYEVTNLVNGRRYRGSHSTENIHDSYLGSGTAILAAVQKYGRENFKKRVFGFCSEANLNTLEAYFVTEKEVADKNFYNMIPGGGRPPKLTSEQARANGLKLSKEERQAGQKATVAARKLNGNYVVSEEQKRKISDTNKQKGIKPPSQAGVVHSIELRKKNSDAQKLAWIKRKMKTNSEAQSKTLTVNY